MISKIQSRRFLPACLALVCLALGAADALRADDEVVKYPADSPLVVLKVPKDWQYKKSDGNLLFRSPDQAITVLLSKGIADEMASEKLTLEETAKKFVDSAGLTDIETKSGDHGEQYGMKFEIAAAKGKKEGKDYGAILMKLTLPNGGSLVAVSFGEQAVIKKDESAQAIFESLRPAK